MQATPPPADVAAPLAMGIVMFVIWGVMILTMIALAVFWVIALIDVAKREFPGQNDKLMWILIVVLAGWIGALIYWFVGRQRGTIRA
jgi:uncharacterized integral membrane protein